MWWRELLALGQAPEAPRAAGPAKAKKPELGQLAPSLVLALGVAVAILVLLLGLFELRSQADSAIAFRSHALSVMLGERLRATAATDRPAVIDKAAQRSGSEVLLVEQDGSVVVDGSLGAPSRNEIVDLLVTGQGKIETRAGPTRYFAATLGAPLEYLSIITFVPDPRLPIATGSLVGSVAALTALLVGAAALVAFTYARDVQADVSFVRERIVEMARENAGPVGKLIAVRDADHVGILTSAFNELVERFRAAERAYQQDLAGALAYDRDRTAFLAALSHELRTPLNAILGFADVLLTEVDGPLSEDSRENLTVLRRSAEHLRELIDDILDLSALESGELRLEVGSVDVYELAAEVVREARVTAQDRPIDVSLAGDPAVAWADGRRVRQILENLVSNAVKFTRRGTVQVTVGLSGDRVVLSVADTGPGIPEDERAAIFEEYRQTHASRSSGTGAGLGLAITRRLVRMHEGKIELESEVGRGTKFTVSLPIQATRAPVQRFISTAPPSADAAVEVPR